MTYCTYYDLLGVSQTATTQEITDAKIFLIKKFHPDANIGDPFDTTLYIQKILEAYSILSNPDTRKRYDRKMLSILHRNRNNNSRNRYSSEEFYPDQPSFAPYWEAANKLNEIVKESIPLFRQHERANKSFLNSHFFHKVKQAEARLSEIKTCEEELTNLAHLATPFVTLLTEASIPRKYWQSNAMNWLLLQWSQNRDLDYCFLFSMYDTYILTYKSESEQNKLTNKNQSFLSSLEKLLEKEIPKE